MVVYARFVTCLLTYLQPIPLSLKLNLNSQSRVGTRNSIKKEIRTLCLEKGARGEDGEKVHVHHAQGGPGMEPGTLSILGESQ